MMAMIHRLIDWLRGTHDRESTQEWRLAIREGRDAAARSAECTQQFRRDDVTRAR